MIIFLKAFPLEADPITDAPAPMGYRRAKIWVRTTLTTVFPRMRQHCFL